MARLWKWAADQRLVVGPQPHLIRPAARVIGPRPGQTVQAPARFVWDEKRWRRSLEDGYAQITGRYRAFDRQRRAWREFEGYLTQRGRHITAYIADPPVEIKRHRHGPCFQLVHGSWFQIHWQRRPKNLDEALLHVEQILDEAINEGRYS